tara:strand:- start:610 stop:948 length:339 start_codon:yes stop_codon:yes gene_type:complete
MKITRQKLREIIKKEIYNMINEGEHTFSGNPKFMKKTILPLLRKAGIGKLKVKAYGDTLLDVYFDADDEQFNNIKKLVNQKIGKTGSAKWKNLNLNLEGIGDKILKIKKAKK